MNLFTKTYRENQKDKSNVVIKEVLDKTSGGNHSWVIAKTKKGDYIKIRKPNEMI